MKPYFRLDSDDDLGYTQLRSEAEMTMQELTTLAQHTSVSCIDILLGFPLILCVYAILGHAALIIYTL